MFGFVSQETYERIVRHNRCLNDVNEALVAENNRLLDRLKELNAPSDEVSNLPVLAVSQNGIEMFAFDWIAGKAFSIERIHGKTVIGYINAEGKNGEWNFACDEAAHMKLVEEFREYVKVKYA
jgi:hypothetical protein